MCMACLSYIISWLRTLHMIIILFCILIFWVKQLKWIYVFLSAKFIFITCIGLKEGKHSKTWTRLVKNWWRFQIKKIIFSSLSFKQRRFKVWLIAFCLLYWQLYLYVIHICMIGTSFRDLILCFLCFCEFLYHVFYSRQKRNVLFYDA